MDWSGELGNFEIKRTTMGLTSFLLVLRLVEDLAVDIHGVAVLVEACMVNLPYLLIRSGPGGR